MRARSRGNVRTQLLPCHSVEPDNLIVVPEIKRKFAIHRTHTHNKQPEYRECRGIAAEQQYRLLAFGFLAAHFVAIALLRVASTRN